MFLLSALGFSRLRALIDEKLPTLARRLAMQAVLVALIGLTLGYYIWFGLYQRDLWSSNKGHVYYQVAKEIEQTVPSGSYVGSVEFAGAFRIYTKLGSYLSVHDNSPKLVDHVLQQGHEVYLIVEPWNATNPVVVQLLSRYSAVKVRYIRSWGGCYFTACRHRSRHNPTPHCAPFRRHAYEPHPRANGHPARDPIAFSPNWPKRGIRRVFATIPISGPGVRSMR